MCLGQMWACEWHMAFIGQKLFWTDKGGDKCVFVDMVVTAVVLMLEE